MLGGGWAPGHVAATGVHFGALVAVAGHCIRPAACGPQGRCHVPCLFFGGGAGGPSASEGGRAPRRTLSGGALVACCRLAFPVLRRSGRGEEVARPRGPPSPIHWVWGGRWGAQRGPIGRRAQGIGSQGKGAQGSPGLQDSERSESRPRGYAAHLAGFSRKVGPAPGRLGAGFRPGESLIHCTWFYCHITVGRGGCGITMSHPTFEILSVAGKEE